jgi:F-type H+-transporting ATPase subunit beta
MQETIESFRAVIDGEMDQYPEQAFYMVGGKDDVIEKAAKLEEQAA